MKSYQVCTVLLNHLRTSLLRPGCRSRDTGSVRLQESYGSEACSHTSALRSGLAVGALQDGLRIMRYSCPLASDRVWLLTTSTCSILCCSNTIGEGSVRLNVLVAGSTGGPSEGDLGSGYRRYCAYFWQDETSLIRPRTLAQAQTLIDISILIILFCATHPHSIRY